MLLGGKKRKHNVKILVLPREGEDGPIVFKCGAVTDMELFEKLCPPPVPPLKVLKGGEKVPDFEDKGFITSVAQQADRRWDYIVLRSLLATDGLVWETVDLNLPETWANWRKEAIESGLSHFETNKIVNTVVQANSLSEDMLEEARKTFLAGQVQA